MTDFTLQINLSPGDVDYAALTVPALLAPHPRAAERLLVVDVCKPQATRIIDPAKRYPEPRYSQRAEAIVRLAEDLRTSGQVDRVVVLRPDDPLFPALRRRYLRPWIKETHDYGGCALLAYLAAFELCRTPWLLHYDADMLAHNAPGTDWVADAQAALARRPELVAAIPRPAPPLPSDQPDDLPSLDERISARDYPEGWGQAWFSTRCYLFDMSRLRAHLPLVQGRLWWEMLATRLRGQGYPRSPEIMLFRRLGAAGRLRLCLRRRDSWLLHPVKKGPDFVAALPSLLRYVRDGRYPALQAGRQNIDLDAWASWNAEGPT